MRPLLTTGASKRRAGFVLALGLAAATAPAQSPKPELVTDINTSLHSAGGCDPDAGRTFVGGVLARHFLRQVPKVFFAATTTTAGTEPYVSAGTASTTVMLGDINPGDASSKAHGFTLSGDGTKLYFAADDGAHGEELWVCDLTATPPKCTLAKDLLPGPYPSSPADLAAIGQR